MNCPKCGRQAYVIDVFDETWRCWDCGKFKKEE